MTLVFSRPMQIGYVVNDIETSMREWTKSKGIGPWFYAERFALTGYRYRGKKTAGPVVSVAQSYVHDMQIELIQVRPGGGANLYEEFLAKAERGIHHWACMVPNFDAAYERASAAGMKPAHEGDTYRGRLAYFENESVPDALIELIEATPERVRIFDRMRELAAGWDGLDPIRTTWPS